MSEEMKRADEDILLKRIRDEREDFLLLIQQEHDSKVTETFIAETRACYELQALHLTKVGLGTEHMDVEELGDIVVSRVRIFFAEGCTYRSRLLLDEGAFVCDGLCG